MPTAFTRPIVIASFLVLANANAALAAPIGASIQGRNVRWTRICLSVPESFQPLGTFNFTLPQSAGSRTIFAQLNDKAVTDMIVVQAEHMLSPSDSYRYPLRPGIQVAAVPFKVNVFASSNTLGALQAPTAETALTASFLSKLGLRTPDQWLVVRYATYDATGQNEFLLFYMEPLDLDTLNLALIGPGDLPELTKAFDRIRKRGDAIVSLSGC
jgi:hypothetical protein